MEKEKLAPDFVECPLDRVLQLVEEGNPDIILDEENLEYTFNELMKHGLIALEDEKLSLTSLGKAAREEGFENFIERQKQEQAQEEVKIPAKKTAVIRPSFFMENRRLWSLSLFLLVLMVMIYSLFSLVGE